MNFKLLGILQLPLLLVLLYMMGCTSRIETPGPVSTREKEVYSGSPKLKTGWEKNWEEMLSSAKKEGKVNIISLFTPDQRDVMSLGFKNKYGIKMDTISGRAAELSEKLFRERKAGIYDADVWLGGTMTLINRFKPAGLLEPLELLLPEVNNPEVWWEGRLPFVDNENKYVFAFQAAPAMSFLINTEQVKLDKLYYKDLLDPKWKGKIVLNDPTTPGSGARFFGVSYKYYTGIDFWRDFVARQEPLITRDQRLLIEWVAKGKYAIALGAGPGPDEEFRKAGAPIKSLNPADGGYLTTGNGGVVLINRAPHPSAAKVFINWLLTREAQILITEVSERQSARIDMPMDLLDRIKEAGKRKPGEKYIMTEKEEFLNAEEEWYRLALEIFSPLLR